MIGDIKKDKYIYYTAFDNDGVRHSINENVVTDAILSYFKEIRLNMIPKTIIDEVLEEELMPLKKELSSLKRNKSRKYHKELQLHDFIETNSIEDEDFITEELENIEMLYSNLTEKIEQKKHQIQKLTQKCYEVMQKRLYDIYIQLDSKNQRKILELVTNKFELQSKKVKLTFKSTFRKIRKR